VGIEFAVAEHVVVVDGGGFGAVFESFVHHGHVLVVLAFLQVVNEGPILVRLLLLEGLVERLDLEGLFLLHVDAPLPLGRRPLRRLLLRGLLVLETWDRPQLIVDRIPEAAGSGGALVLFRVVLEGRPEALGPLSP